MSHIPILETAFVKYLKNLSLEQRASYLLECLINRGELAVELAEYFKVYDPALLAIKLEEEEIK